MNLKNNSVFLVGLGNT